MNSTSKMNPRHFWGLLWLSREKLYAEMKMVIWLARIAYDNVAEGGDFALST